MFKKKFIYSYNYEGFCRACYNHWRFCDCVGDLLEDVGFGENDKDNDDDNAQDDGSDAVNGVGSIVNVVTPSPSKRPRPKPGTLDTSGSLPPKRPALLPPEDPTDEFMGGDWIDDAISDITDTIYVPNVLTPEELNDHVVNSGDYAAPVGAIFSVPTLEDLGAGYVPYSQSNVPVSVLLQSDEGVPHFYGKSVLPNGEPTVEYKKWYFESFVPWYNNTATPDQKHLLAGVVCLEPGPDLGERKWLNLPDIYLNKQDRGQGKEIYYWSVNGRDYVKEGRQPSRLELWFPERFDTVKDVSVRSVRKTARSPYFATSTIQLPLKPLKPIQSVFPDIHEDQIYDTSIVNYTDISIPEVIVPDVNSVNSFVEKGNGTETSIMYPEVLTNPNLWKYGTYQMLSYAPLSATENHNILQTSAQQLPFFGSNKYILSRSNVIIQTHFYNHLRTGSKPLHGVCKFAVKLIPRAGQPVLGSIQIRLVGAPAGVRIILNNPDSVSDIQYGPLPNGSWLFGTNVNALTFYVYIPPQANAHYDNTKYITLEYITTPAPGYDVEFTEVACFRNRLSITPSFEPNISLSSTVDYNNIGLNLKVDVDGISNRCSVLGVLSDPNGVNVPGFFSKCWLRSNEEPVTILHDVFGLVPPRSFSWPKVNTTPGVWSVVPLIGAVYNGGSQEASPLRVVIQNPTANSEKNTYRVQHLNISNSWIN